MSDDSMDDLIALYRNAAREAPRPKMDAKILQLAETRSPSRRRSQQRAWTAVAVAACALLWFAGHRAALPFSSPTQTSTHSVAPGYLDGRNRTYLMTMDITPPHSPTAQFLLRQSFSSN